MQIALAGRPGAGKSMLLDLLARRGEASASSAARGEAARGGLRITHVDVPDPRLVELSDAYRPKKITPARLQFEDLEQKSGPSYPGLTPQRREMLAQTDLILLVVDLFSHDPQSWAEIGAVQWREAMEEFLLLDLAVVETRRERLEKQLKAGHAASFPGEPEILARVQAVLEAGHPVRSLALTEEEKHRLRGYAFLSGRPILPACNVAEEHLVGTALVQASRPEMCESLPSVLFCAEVERQIQELPPEEQGSFLEAFGLSEPAVAQVIRAAYHLAGLHCFFTVGEDEVRAWSVRKGAFAPEAAGVIHSDLEKSFVRAEVLGFEDWKKLGSFEAAREKGLVRLEGKEYEVQDGDILNIRSGLAKGRG